MEHGGQGGQGGQGAGSPGEKGAGEGSIWGRKAGAEIKKTHSYFVYNRLSSSFRTSSYLTSTDALKPSLSIPNTFVNFNNNSMAILIQAETT